MLLVEIEGIDCIEIHNYRIQDIFFVAGGEKTRIKGYVGTGSVINIYAHAPAEILNLLSAIYRQWLSRPKKNFTISFVTNPTAPFVILKEGGNFITKDYKKTVRYWDEIFEQVESCDPFEEIRIPRIEEGLNWICKDSRYILDFGFGTGKALFRCLAKGVKRVCGIEISGSAVNLARVVAEKNGLKGRVNFIQGSNEVLKNMESGRYDGMILFNILDNIKPGDSMDLIAEASRILKPDGKVLVKLNSYLKTDQTGSFKRLAEDFYLEETGLYLWNLSNAKFRKIIEPFFNEEKFAVIEFKEQKTANRMFYLRNKRKAFD